MAASGRRPHRASLAAAMHPRVRRDQQRRRRPTLPRLLSGHRPLVRQRASRRGRMLQQKFLRQQLWGFFHTRGYCQRRALQQACSHHRWRRAFVGHLASWLFQQAPLYHQMWLTNDAGAFAHGVVPAVVGHHPEAEVLPLRNGRSCRCMSTTSGVYLEAVGPHPDSGAPWGEGVPAGGVPLLDLRHHPDAMGATRRGCSGRAGFTSRTGSAARHLCTSRSGGSCCCRSTWSRIRDTSRSGCSSSRACISCT